MFLYVTDLTIQGVGIFEPELARIQYHVIYKHNGLINTSNSRLMWLCFGGFINNITVHTVAVHPTRSVVTSVAYRFLRMYLEVLDACQGIHYGRSVKCKTE